MSGCGLLLIILLLDCCGSGSDSFSGFIVYLNNYGSQKLKILSSLAQSYNYNNIMYKK